MSSPVDLLAQHAAVLAELVGDMPWGSADSSLDELLSGAKEETVLDLAARVGEIVRFADAVAARVAGNIEQRSDRALPLPLSSRLGEKNAAAAITAITGIHPSRTKDWCEVGSQLAGRTTLTGEPLPSLRPVVAAAVDSGALALDAARVVLAALRAIEPFASVDELADLEGFLVGQARLLPLNDLAKLCRALPDRFDPDGIEPREEALRARAEFTMIKHRDGTVSSVIRWDTESLAYAEAALGARMNPHRRVGFTDPTEFEPPDPATTDRRTLPQRRLAALTSIFRDALKADTGDTSGVDTTVLVTIDHQALLTGVGTGVIFGLDTPVSAATVRRMACDARIIPVVLGGASQPLDLGTGRRLFTPAQRHAMAVRDGGCIWPGCNEPPSRCQAAHLTPWADGGPTDLGNGVLLCPFHHRRFDNDGWTLTTHPDATRALIPPPWIDPRRTPRPIPARATTNAA